MTIVCDRDIMTLNGCEPTIQDFEKILATLLVCDWNMRAWTLLEAMRSRSGIYLLCRDNKAVSLYEVIKSVHEKGRIDIVALFLTRGYLLPPLAIADEEIFGQQIGSQKEQETQQGFMSIAEAAVHLSHRHATRDSDDLLIWSLLIGDVEDESPVELWKRQVGQKIPTGYIVSSAVRIEGHHGFSWAPYQPTILRRTTGLVSSMRSYPAYDGTNTFRGTITMKGLQSMWLVYEFANGDDLDLEEANALSTGSATAQIRRIKSQHLHGYSRGVLMQTCPSKGSKDRAMPYTESEINLLVVCASNDGFGWEWKGVYEWDISAPLPQFVIKDMLLV